MGVLHTNKKLIVITSGAYPYGGATTNRHISYLRGLAELGIEIKMYILHPSNDQPEKSKNDQGEYKGIHYQYLNDPTQSIRGTIKRMIHVLRTAQKAKRSVSSEINSKIDTCLLVLITNPFEIRIFLKLAKSKQVDIFHERTEFPYLGVISVIDKWYFSYYLKLIKNFTGIFVITEALKSYFKPYLPPEKIVIIPMTVEPDRFSCEYNPEVYSKYGNYIAYCGSMYTDKDGVPILIEAFDQFAENNKDVNLLLIGDTENTAKFRLIQQKIKNANHSDRIILTGQVDRDQIPGLLCHADVLALARPDNIQAQGGFPTKLGEYLATAKPVAVTAVGEIPEYLTHMQNAFISESESSSDFADVLELIYSDRKAANAIGKEGKKLTFGVFNYKVQASILLKFFFN